CPSFQRYSMAMVRPSTQPSSPSRCTKAAVHGRQPAASDPLNPIVGSLPDCCPCAASGHAAAPPSTVRNRRRRTSNIRQPLPWLRRWSVYRTVRLPQRGLQVLGVDLNCSEIGGLMSALGQKRTSRLLG